MCPAGHDHIENVGNAKRMDSDDCGGIIDESAHFPDGGVQAWCTVLGGFLSFIAGIGFLSGGSVFQSYFQTVVLPESSPSDIAWIGSVQVWGCFFLGTWSGRLSDKYGPALPLAIGTFFLAFGNMMASLSKTYYQFLLSQGFCVALGMGLIFTPALAVQSQWFFKRRGFVVGLVMSGQMVGGIIWPIMADQLLHHRNMSFGWTLRIIAFMQLGIMIAAGLLVRPRFPQCTGHESLPIRKYFRDRRTLLFSLAIFLMDLGLYVPWFFITPYALASSVSASLSFYDAAILNAGGFLGCYALGTIADSGLGFFNSLTAATLACAVVAFGWIGAHSNVGIIVWAVVYGILSGALQAIFSPCISLLAPTPEVIGSWNGICITIASFAVLGTGPIAGKLLDNVEGTSYLPMQLFTGISLTLSGILFLVVQLWICRDGLA
ncbi:major facilitator superfamily domain-containing protein [Aspergillus ambiguus]|uniref:major facilitator superfamily domain-containing protein n=1 Tax=Aspergillus ambiguus TaxID=176160 RepID=UPI003CCCDBB5